MAKLTSTDVYGTLNVQGNTSVEGEVAIGTTAPVTLSRDTSIQRLKIQTDEGFITIGAQNSSYAHFYTDRLVFYFGAGTEIAGNIVGRGNLYLNGDNSPSNTDTFIYFGDDESDTAHFIQFDDSAQSFVLSNQLNVSGNITTSDNLYLNVNNSPSDTDTFIYFGDDESDTTHFIQFDNSEQKFNFSNDILVNGSPLASGPDEDTIEWRYIGKLVDTGNNNVLDIDETDIGEDFDWINYDYKFVYQGHTNGEDTSQVTLKFNNDSTADKYSYLYTRVRQTSTIGETEEHVGDSNSAVIGTGVGLSPHSAGGYATEVEVEFTVRMSLGFDSGFRSYVVRGEGHAHYWPGTQALSTAYDGMVQSRFVGSYRAVDDQSGDRITSVTIEHYISTGTIDINLVRVYKRKKY